VLAALLIAGCGVDQDKGIFMAAGSYGDLAVLLSDEGLAPTTNRFLGEFNTSHTFVINEETLFNPDVFTPERWELAKGYKNILLVVHLGGGGKVEKAARNIVSGDSWDRLEAAGGGLVQIKDPWSTYQLAIVVASRDRNSLGSQLRRNAARLRDMFETSNRERILRRNRYDGLHEQLMNTYWDRYGVFMEIPGVFHQTQREPDGFPAFELMLNGPSRGISVSWARTSDAAAFLKDDESLLALRERLGAAIHDEEIIPEAFVWSEAEIGGVSCRRLEGAWASNRIAGGGPFWSYFIPDPKGERVFCVDMLVFAPGMEKMSYFRRLDAIASTFSTTRPQP